MKIRSGFVSNSSSSSFIVHGETTTAQVATLMLYEIKRRWSDTIDSFDCALKWLENNQDHDGPITFPWSINEDTHLWREDAGIFVSTCNNENWRIVGGDYSFKGVDGDVSDILYYGIRDKPFLDLSDMTEKTIKQFY